MIAELTFAGYTARLREFISSFDFRVSGFEELAFDLFRLQFDGNAVYRRFCESRRVSPDNIRAWNEIPAVPALAFKEFDLTSLPPVERTHTFLSSGTTGQSRSRHVHSAESLMVYEASLLPWFERHLLADLSGLVDEELLGPFDKMPFLFLTPPPSAAPNSSLVHMFDHIRRQCGSTDSAFVGRTDAAGAWNVDINSALFAIRKSMCANRPLAILGTAFSFVHLLDHFAANNMRYRVARGSRVMETGGYKGQSREVAKAELHVLITKHLGIQREFIVTEYGMSELSSQAYDRVVGIQGPTSKGQGENAHVDQSAIRNPQSAVFHFPPWARSQIISPETGHEVSDGETGLLRIFDLANVRSVMAIQTEDLAVRRGDGFELLGRAAQTEPRGCSLMSLNGNATG